MPVKSKAQWRYLAWLYSQGKISKRKFDEWVKGVKYSKLPRHKRKYKKK